MIVNMQKYSISFNEVAEEQIKTIPRLKLPSKMQIIGVL
jgi:hypothetical protein